MDKNLESYIRRQGLLGQIGPAAGVVSTPNAVPSLPNWELDWAQARNQYANAAIGEELQEPRFFGVSMGEHHMGGFGKRVNALWALGFRLHLAGLYNGMQSRVYAAAVVGDDVQIFLQTKQGKAVLVTDAKTNFPSDELITKLRMLEG